MTKTKKTGKSYLAVVGKKTVKENLMALRGLEKRAMQVKMMRLQVL